MGTPATSQDPSTARPRARPAAWQWFLALGVTVGATYYFLPGIAAQSVAYDGLGAAAAAAMFVGAWKRQRGRRAPVACFALGTTMWVLGDSIWTWHEVVLHHLPSYPSVADLVYVLAYPAWATGLLLLVRETGRDRAAAIDAALVTSAAAVMAWVFFAEPYLGSSDGLLARIAAVSYPLVDVLLIGAVSRVAFTVVGMSQALRLILVGLIGTLVADVAYSILMLGSGYSGGSWVDAGWLLFYTAWGTAALHPSMAVPLRRTKRRAARFTWRRVVILGVTSVFPTIALLTVLVAGRSDDLSVLVATSAFTFLLVGARIAQLGRLVESESRTIARHEEELQATVAKLAAAEERYRTLVEEIPAITYIDVRDETETWGSRTTYVSPQVEDLLGCRPDELVNDASAWDRLVHPDDFDRVMREDARVTEGEIDWHEEYRMVARDGRVLWVSDHAVVVRDSEGRPLYWQGVVFDVTARRQAEESRREAEAKYRALIEQLPAITFLDDLGEEGGPDRYAPLYVSPQVHSILGFTPEEWLSGGGLWRSRLHPDDRERVLETAERCTASGTPIRQEYRLLAADERIVWVREESLQVQGVGSRLWQGVLFDITELKRAEERTRDAEHRLRTLVEEIPAATYILGEVEAGSGRFVTLYESPQIEAILGYPTRSWDDPEFHLSIVDPRDRERVAREEARTDATGDRFFCEYRVRAADGREVWLREEAVLADAEPTVPRRWLGVISDVSREKGAQEEIERYSRELEEANLELRASEGQLVATLDVLSRVESERRRLLDGTVQSLERERSRLAIELHDGPIQRLTALGIRLAVLRKRVASGESPAVDEMFELAQTNLGADIDYLRHLMSGLRPPSLDLHGLEAAIRDFADAACGDAGLACTVDADIPDRLGDALETVLYRVVQEALTNVVKHARAQSVRVSLRVRRGSVELEVVDDGVGVAAEPQRLDGLPHLGILGMRERIEMVGGTWEIGPGRVGGTRVHAVVPLDGGVARPADEAKPHSPSAIQAPRHAGSIPVDVSGSEEH